MYRHTITPIAWLFIFVVPITCFGFDRGCASQRSGPRYKRPPRLGASPILEKIDGTRYMIFKHIRAKLDIPSKEEDVVSVLEDNGLILVPLYQYNENLKQSDNNQ